MMGVTTSDIDRISSSLTSMLMEWFAGPKPYDEDKVKSIIAARMRRIVPELDKDREIESLRSQLSKAVERAEKAEAECDIREGFIADCIVFLRGSEKAGSDKVLEALFKHKPVWNYPGGAGARMRIARELPPPPSEGKD
jgi:hypothetical protein